jgi:hypothetical protein
METAIPGRGDNESDHTNQQASARREKCPGKAKQDRRQLLRMKLALPNCPANCGDGKKSEKPHYINAA